MTRSTLRRWALIAVATLGLTAVACGADEDPEPAIDDNTRSSSTTTTEGTGGSGGPESTAPPTGSLADARVRASLVVEADNPTALAPRAGTDTLYVAERGGTVRTLEIADDGTGTLGDEPVLDLSDQTTTSGELGLLGLTFSEDGETLYASYTNLDGDTRLDAYAMDGDRADADSRREVAAVDQPSFSNHKGGDVVLGPDGLLWLGLGDGGSAGDPDNRAQDPEDPLGKLLRIDPDVDSSSDPEIWAIGLRNPWRFSFDRATDDLWIGDVGQNAVEEIDFLPAGTEAGANFGWSGFEGSQVYAEGRVPDESVQPVFEMSHDDGWCSVTGGVVYRGERIPDLQGSYLFGDYCLPGLHGLTLEDGAVSAQRELGVEIASLVSIDEDADGEVYLLSLDGGISRLDPA